MAVAEEEMVQLIPQSAAMRKLAEQDAAYAGENGALLYAVSAKDGPTLAKHKLGSLPAFDGMIAADGKILYSGVDGTLYSLGN